MNKATSTVPKRRFITRLKLSLPIYAILLPSIIALLLFHYWPIYGISIAFKNFNPYKGILNSTWVGLRYFRQFLSDENYWRVMRNTVVINFYHLIFGFPFPILFALMLNELRRNKLKRFVQTVSYLPHFISWVVTASIVTTILSPAGGVVNQIIEALGGESIYFLSKQRYFRTILVMSDIWKGFGMSAVYYIAALSGIDQELYEAAAIDGAGRLKQTWHITLPGLRNIIVVLLILRMGNMISIGFEQIFLLYNPLVYDVGDVISTYTYRIGLVEAQYSLTSAIGLTQSIVNFALVYFANRLSRSIAGWSIW